MGREVVKTADYRQAADAPENLVVRDGHRGEVGAGRMSDEMQPPGIAAEVTGARRERAHGGGDGAHHHLERCIWRERIADRGERAASRVERGRRKAAVVRVAAHVGAAVHQGDDRRRRIRGREDADILAFARSVGEHD